MQYFSLLLICVVHLCYSEEVPNGSLLNLAQNVLSNNKRATKILPNDHHNQTDKIKLRTNLNDVFLLQKHKNPPRHEPITSLRKRKKTLPALKRINDIHPSLKHVPKGTNTKLFTPTSSHIPYVPFHVNKLVSKPKSPTAVEDLGNKTKKLEKVPVENSTAEIKPVLRTELPINRLKADNKSDFGKKEKHDEKPVIHIQTNKTSSLEIKSKEKVIEAEESTLSNEHKNQIEVKENNAINHDRHVLEKVMKQLPDLIKLFLADKTNTTENKHVIDSTEKLSNLNLTFTKSDRSDEVLKLLITTMQENNKDDNTDSFELNLTSNIQNGTINSIKYTQNNGTSCTNVNAESNQPETDTTPDHKIHEINDDATIKSIPIVNNIALNRTQQFKKIYQPPIPSHLQMHNTFPYNSVGRVTLPFNPYRIPNYPYTRYQHLYNPDFTFTKPYGYQSVGINRNCISDQATNNNWKNCDYNIDNANVDLRVEEMPRITQPAPIFTCNQAPLWQNNYYSVKPYYNYNPMQSQPWPSNFYQDQNLPGSCVFSRLAYSYPYKDNVFNPINQCPSANNRQFVAYT